MVNKQKSKADPMNVGTRVRHSSNPILSEGVVVWKHSCGNAIGQRDVDGRVWSVHWSNEERGVYRTSDINKIPPKNMKATVLNEIEKENEEVHAEE